MCLDWPGLQRQYTCKQVSPLLIKDGKERLERVSMAETDYLHFSGMSNTLVSHTA